MKSQKIRDLDDNELQHQLHTIEEQLFRLSFQMSKKLLLDLIKVIRIGSCIFFLFFFLLPFGF